MAAAAAAATGAAGWVARGLSPGPVLSFSRAPERSLRRQAGAGGQTLLLPPPSLQDKASWPGLACALRRRRRALTGSHRLRAEKPDNAASSRVADLGPRGDEDAVDPSTASISASAGTAGNGVATSLPTEAGEKALPVSDVTGWRTRWTMVGLCFFAFLLCNMDRVNMAISILPMSTEFGWDSTTMGVVQSSFFWGYLLTQIAGGVWADRIGGKRVLGFGVIWWSLATALTPIAAKSGLPVLLATRACMGIGEGVAMPAMNSVLSKWVPVNERSRSLALVYSGMFMGSVAGLSCSPSLIQSYGWPSVFYLFGAAGIIWFALWQRFAASSPEQDAGLADMERRYIAANIPKQERVERIPWGKLLSKPAVWAIIVCHFCHNWGTFILLTWMPTYYNQVLGFNLSQSGLYSVLPWLTMAIASNLGGWLADSLVKRGVSVTLVRKIMQSLGFLGPAFFLSRLKYVSSPLLAVACMMGSQGFDAFSQSGLYSNHQDIGPRYAGVLLGLSNTAGVLAGVVGTFTTGYILKRGSWDDVFSVAVWLYLIGTVIWNVFSTGEKVID
eukprot:jgi/Chlat1/396/Chrsp10S01506